MLINSAISILNNARVALGDLSLLISRNIALNLNFTDEQKDLRRRLVLTYGIIKALDPVLKTTSEGTVDYILGDYSDVKINRLLLYLKDISRSADQPLLPEILNPIAQNRFTGQEITQPGADGVNAYLYIGYADDSNGAGYSTSATNKSFIALRQSNVPLSPITAGTFAGLWRQFVGNPGAPGDDGDDGQPIYFYVAYADDNAGNGFTSVFNPVKKYIATKVSLTPLLPAQSDFAGLWAKYIGEDGADGDDGADGNTILSGVGVPGGGLGNNGDYYRDTTNSNFYGPKTAGNWGSPLDLKGDPGDDGLPGDPGDPGADGADAFLYIAYADSSDGTGFTNTYSPTKSYIAIKKSLVEIISPAASDFAGLWKKYSGDGGDRYATTSTTTMTIGIANQFFVVDKDLAYTTGQRAVIALNGDPNNRMEGVVINYDSTTGQLSVAVDTIYGSGTYSTWDVNLAGAPTSIASQNAYYATIATDQGSAGTPQALSVTPAKITQFDALVSQSIGMTGSIADDTITVANNGAYVIDFNAIVSGTPTADILFQIYINGTAVPNAIARAILAATPQQVSIHYVADQIQQADVFEVRAVASAATPNLLVEQGRFSIYTVGYINSEQYKDFENADVDTGTETCDNFLASLGNAAKFEYRVKKGVNFRTGVIFAVWDGTNQPEQDESGTISIGDTEDLLLEVDFSAGDIRLRATAASNDWAVKGKRTIIG